jgi:hypothetical protein
MSLHPTFSQPRWALLIAFLMFGPNSHFFQFCPEAISIAATYAARNVGSRATFVYATPAVCRFSRFVVHHQTACVFQRCHSWFGVFEGELSPT